MTSEDIYKIIKQVFETMETPIIPDISNAFIPFSNITSNEKSSYIYDGSEILAFNERHPKYQKIFITEFSVI